MTPNIRPWRAAFMMMGLTVLLGSLLSQIPSSQIQFQTDQERHEITKNILRGKLEEMITKSIIVTNDLVPLVDPKVFTNNWTWTNTTTVPTFSFEKRYQSGVYWTNLQWFVFEMNGVRWMEFDTNGLLRLNGAIYSNITYFTNQTTK